MSAKDRGEGSWRVIWAWRNPQMLPFPKTTWPFFLLLVKPTPHPTPSKHEKFREHSVTRMSVRVRKFEL